MKNKTIPIVFHAGGYGTYLEWVLTTLTSNDEIIWPFTNKGNSHNFQGNHVGTTARWLEYLNSNENYTFVRLHPKITQEENLEENLKIISDSAEQFVYILVDPDSLLLGLANQYEKVRDDWWDVEFKYYINKELIYNNWPVDPTFPISKLPEWIKREFLSLYMMPMWHEQIGWNNQLHWNYPNCQPITIKQLLYQFESTIARIGKELKLQFVRPVKELLSAHNQMLALQKNLNIDQTCNQIVNAVISNESISWDPISLIGEGWVQWQLRNLGYEIRCNGLDLFPTNSVKLQELIYKI
jgi:hypothetical protein